MSGLSISLVSWCGVYWFDWNCNIFPVIFDWQGFVCDRDRFWNYKSVINDGWRNLEIVSYISIVSIFNFCLVRFQLICARKTTLKREAS